MIKLKNTIIVLVIILGFSCNNNEVLLQQVSQISDKVRDQFAPDSREAIYAVNFSIDASLSVVVSGETSLPEAKLALFSTLEELNVHLIDSLVLLPEKKLGDKNWGLINLSVVNLRAHPRHSAELVSQAIMGTPVRVLNKSNSWYQIQTPDKYIAWVDVAALNLRTENEMKQWRESKRVVFIPSFRLAKDLKQEETVTDVVAGSILQVQTNNEKYYSVLLPDFRVIRLEKSDCKEFEYWKKKEISDVSILTKTAKEFIGRPYLWGGTSSKGVDCSGFVKSVYFMNGIILARDASLQFLHGDTISPEQGFTKLKEGDLVFFGRTKTENEAQKVTHVGMYMNDGEYIHSSGRVKINSFDSNAENFNNYRSVSWLGGRRVLTRVGEPGLIRVSEHPWY